MTNFGKYDLLERLASGGMAELFLARQTGVGGFSKTVVIKRIHKHLSADYEFTTMFINEARVSAQLSHQNIVQVYDFGEHDGSYFIAMEYVFGQDLKSTYKLCRKKRLQMPLPLAIYIIQQVCKGLDYAHRKKDAKGRPLDIVHRDVSPQNVLISYEGEVKVADFGIAKAASSSRMTQAGTLKGKIAYMSPEQAWGKTVDRRSDIFSIGIVFWEILTNQRLFFGNSDFDTLERVRNCDIPDITQMVPSLSKEIDRILRKALSKDVETRYQSAAEMHHDLEVFSAAHGFYNQSPELANFLRGHFLQGDEVDDLSSSGSHPRVLTQDGNISESSQPIEVIDRNESSGRVVAPPPPPTLPAVAQQIVAQARETVKTPAARPIQEEDDTYQAPPLSEDFLKNAVVPAAKNPPPASSKAERTTERSTELNSVRRREATGNNPAQPQAPVKPVKVEKTAEKVEKEPLREPLRRPSPKPVSVAISGDDNELRRPTRRVQAMEPEPKVVEEPPVVEEEEEYAEEEWEEAEAPRSSSLVTILAIFLVVAFLGIGGVGVYVLREKGILLPPSWLPPGRVVVQTLPEAEVYVGSDLKGTADSAGKITVTGIIGGSYDLKISKSGYADWTKRIKVRPNKNYPVSAYLQALQGKLTINANEPGARVYIDGIYYGRTPNERGAGGYGSKFEAVQPGDRIVTVAKSGRRDAETHVEIKTDTEATATLQLQDAPAEWVEITLTANQKNSFAILDGELKGILAPGAPLTLKLEQGIHDLIVVKSSFDPVFDPVIFRQRSWAKQTYKAEFKPATETGALRIMTTLEGYDLIVDGREILRGIRKEATLPGIPQGKHTVRIVHPTLGSQSQEIELAAGKIATVQFSGGNAAKADVQIVTRPSQATVLVDGKFQGVSDLRVSLPKAGTFTVEVTLPGFKRYKKSFSATEVKDKLEIDLEKE